MGREIDRSNNDPILVQGISLDDFAYEQRHPKPKVIKMDIEGGEVLALQGMTRVLREIRPLLFLELHGYSASKTSWNILSSFGYHFYRINSDLDQVTSVDELDWKSYLVAMP